MRFPHNVAAVLSAITGIRQGELLALEWSDILWERLEIDISKSRDQSTGISVTPKTVAGARRIGVTPLAIALLAAYRDQRQQAHAEAVAKAEAAIERYGPTTQRAVKARRMLESLRSEHWHQYLFPARVVASWKGKDGTKKLRRDGRLSVLEARNLFREFQAARKATGVQMTWHAFRHVFATNILANGGVGALHQLAKQLGHTDPSFTLRQYGHIIEGRAQELLRPIDKLLTSGSAPFDLAQLLAQPPKGGRGQTS